MADDASPLDKGLGMRQSVLAPNYVYRSIPAPGIAARWFEGMVRVRSIRYDDLIYDNIRRKRQESNLPRTPTRPPTGLKPARPTGSGTLPGLSMPRFRPRRKRRYGRRAACRFSFNSTIASTFAAPCFRHKAAKAFGSSGSGA